MTPAEESNHDHRAAASADIAALQQQSLDEGDVRATGHRGVVAGAGKLPSASPSKWKWRHEFIGSQHWPMQSSRQMAASIREVMPWFETFLELLRTEEEREAA
jgi:hypothetical protein